MTREFYIVRHGLTAMPGVLLGQCDPALSGEGRRQARELARELAGKGVERVVSSGLRRARETAELLAAEMGVGVETDAGLNEITYGAWDGLSWEQIERIDSETARRKLDGWWSATPAGGESPAEFARRVRRVWNSLLARPPRVLVVVAHEAVNALLVDLARQDPSGDNEQWQPDWRRASSFHQAPGAYCKLTVAAP